VTDTARIADARQSALVPLKEKSWSAKSRRVRALVERFCIVGTDAAASTTVSGLLAAREPCVVSFVNAHAFNLCWNDPALQGSFTSSDALFRDGVGMKILFRLLGMAPGRNMNGTDFIPRILAGAGGRRISLYGTCDPHLSAARERLGQDGHLVVSALDGFRPVADYVEDAEANRPDIIILAMGMPKQELVSLLLRNRASGPCLIINGGAILDFMAERVPRAPLVLQKLGLEWAYRLLQEPGRLWKRYLVGNAAFMMRAAWVAADARLSNRVSPPLRDYEMPDGQPGSAPAAQLSPTLPPTLPPLRGIVIVSPGGITQGGGIASVSRSMARWFEQNRPSQRVFVIDAHGGRLVTSIFLTAWGLCKLVYFRIRYRPDVLHLQLSERSSFARKGLFLIIGKLLGMLVAVHNHGAELIPTYLNGSTLLRRITAFVERGAHRRIVMGQLWRQFMVSHMGIRADDIDVLTNGTPDIGPQVALIRATEPRKVRAEAHDLSILVLAVLQPRKGISELLRALAVLRQRGVTVFATFAGRGDVARYRNEAHDLGLGTSVEFLGWVPRDHVPGLLAQCDAFVLPSYDEGLPISILEAFAARVPVIATPVGAIPEVLQHGESALLVEPGDVNGLAEAIQTLAAWPELREALSTAARQRYEKDFTIDAFMQKLLCIYQTASVARAARR
jgi:exopolysaccharide biosynthesis WecB/TagA/CpsF family protein